MNGLIFPFCNATLHALGSGALWWPAKALLCVSDLHLGKAERMSRRSGIPAPPYEVQDTLGRLQTDLETTKARTVICLGDSFDDLAAFRALPGDSRDWILRLQAGRRWIWIEGNHDPGPIDLGGQHLGRIRIERCNLPPYCSPRRAGRDFRPLPSEGARGDAGTQRLAPRFSSRFETSDPAGLWSLYRRPQIR